MAEALAEEDVWSRVYPEEGLLDCPGAALASGTKSREACGESLYWSTPIYLNAPKPR